MATNTTISSMQPRPRWATIIAVLALVIAVTAIAALFILHGSLGEAHTPPTPGGSLPPQGAPMETPAPTPGQPPPTAAPNVPPAPAPATTP